MKKFLVLVIAVILMGSTVYSQNIAFPGAEGFGRYASGGRGGNVYYVTTLQDNGSTSLTGSLRWALNQNSPKTIMFNVSGTIFLASPLSINKGDVTIAGQSAPGDGICIGGFPVTISASNVIIRFVRFRMGDNLDSNADGADALGFRKIKNIIIDHCSMSWSTDECVSIYENENTTLQWCIIAESLRLSGHSKGPHGYGGIWGGNKASFHHNLMAHHDSRTPRLGPGATTQLNEHTDMRNNVIYNWSGNGCYGAEAMNVNIVNNFYKPGPATPTGTKRGRIIGIDKKMNLSTSDSFYPINNKWGKFFIAGNVVDASSSTSSTDINACNNATANNWEYGVYNMFASGYGTVSAEDKAAMKMAEPFATDAVTTHTAQQAYNKVLLYAGASLVRDSHDQRIITETTNGTAQFKGLSIYNGLGSVTYPAGTVIGSTTLTVQTTIDWKSTAHPKWGIIDSQNDLKPAGADANWSAWPTLASGNVPLDTDGDGLPDDWETNNGLNPDNAQDGKLYTLHAAYTNLEIYLNGLVDHIIDNQNKDAITTSIDNVNADVFKMVLYPNPVKDVLNISVNKPISNVVIADIKGRVIKTVKGTEIYNSINISNAVPGVYLVKATTTDGDTLTQKLIK